MPIRNLLRYRDTLWVPRYSFGTGAGWRKTSLSKTTSLNAFVLELAHKEDSPLKKETWYARELLCLLTSKKLAHKKLADKKETRGHTKAKTEATNWSTDREHTCSHRSKGWRPAIVRPQPFPVNPHHPVTHAHVSTPQVGPSQHETECVGQDGDVCGCYKMGVCAVDAARLCACTSSSILCASTSSVLSRCCNRAVDAATGR